MILPDVNVLIYAFRRDLPQHAVCRAWLARVVMSDARFGLSPLVLGAVVRVTTNPRVYRTPSTIEEAFGHCQNLLGQPNPGIVQLCKVELWRGGVWQNEPNFHFQNQ